MVQRCLIAALAFMGFACLARGAEAADRLRIASRKPERGPGKSR